MAEWKDVEAALAAGDADALRDVLEGDDALRARIDEPLIDGDTPLVVAAATRDDFECVRALVELGADINARSTVGAGALDYTWHHQMASWLIEQGLELDAFAAARWGRIDELRALLDADSAAANHPRHGGTRPLHVAKTPEVIDLLLDHGADLEARDDTFGGTPVQWGITEMSGRPDVSAHMLARGAVGDVIAWACTTSLEPLRAAIEADPSWLEERTGEGRLRFGDHPKPHIYCYSLGGATPLIMAAHRGRTAAVKLLLELGAEVNAKDPESRTALHWAAAGDHATVVRALLDAGADTSITESEFGSDAAGWAAFSRAHNSIAVFVERQPITNVSEMAAMGLFAELRDAIDRNPNRLDGDGDGFTPVRSAAFYGYPEILRWLLERGASVHGVNKFGKTALSLARERGWTQSVELLEAAGAKMPDDDPLGPVDSGLD